MGSGAKSYMRKGFLIYEEMRKFFPIYEEAVSHIWLCTRSLWISLYMRNILFSFLSVQCPNKEFFTFHRYSLNFVYNLFIYFFVNIEATSGKKTQIFMFCFRFYIHFGFRQYCELSSHCGQKIYGKKINFFFILDLPTECWRPNVLQSFYKPFSPSVV